MRPLVSSRAGFSLVELIVVAIVGMAVVMAAYQTLTNNLRAHAVINAQMSTQQAVRTGSDVLFAELREISASGGDLVSMGTDSLTVRSMTGFGVVCAVTVGGTPQLDVRRTGDWFEAGDSVFVLADNDEDIGSDDVWLVAKIGSVDTTSTCSSGDAAQTITLPGMTSAMTTDSVRTGAIVRGFEHVWFGLHQYNGSWYLGRKAQGDSEQPLVGPLVERAQNGLHFKYRDAFDAVTTTATDVAQIRVTLRSVSAVVGPQGSNVADSTVTYIHPRN